MKSPRRTILKVLLLLAAGAAVNVAVAWGCPLIWRWSFQSMEPRHPNVEEFAWIQAQGEHPSVMFSGSFRGSIGIGSERRSWILRDPIYEAAEEQKQRLRPPPYSADRIRAGWPVLAMEGYEVRHTSVFVTLHPDRRPIESTIKLGKQFMPAVPLWPGFAINSMFYAAALWMLFAIPGALRRMIRRRRRLCAACGYPIGSSDVCTECGAAVTPRVAHA